MTPIAAIYENGVLRPLSPIELPEGSRVDIIVVEQPELHATQEPSHVDEAEYLSFLGKLDAVAALPLQSPPQPNAAHDHDAILYPKQGTMP